MAARCAELESRRRSQPVYFHSEVSWIERLQTATPATPAPVASVEQRNRVLRNTYWLLALSMVPTVLGAWIGVTTGLMRAHGRRA